MTDDEAIAYALAVVQRRIGAAAAPALTVAQLYEKYEKASSKRGSWPTIMFRLRPVVKALGERLASSLTPSDWTAYREPREKELAVGTLNMELTWLKALVRWGVAEGLLLDEPKVCKAKKVKPDKKHRDSATTEDDVSSLLDEADAGGRATAQRVRDRVIVLCACDSGMRRNEIRQLQWSWIDRIRLEIRIPNWAAKGGRGGAVPMTRRTLAAIDAVPRHIASTYVLANVATGEPYHRGSFTSWWKTLAERAELQPAPGEVRVHLHDGRRGYGTTAARRGVRIEVIQQVYRHASLDQTRDYISTDSVDLAAARETFEAGIERDKRR